MAPIVKRVGAECTPPSTALVWSPAPLLLLPALLYRLKRESRMCLSDHVKEGAAEAAAAAAAAGTGGRGCSSSSNLRRVDEEDRGFGVVSTAACAASATLLTVHMLKPTCSTMAKGM